MREINIASGISGSGKSYLFRQQEGIYVSRDAFRDALRQKLGSHQYFPVNGAEENRRWIEVIKQHLNMAEDIGKPLWIDSTNLTTSRIMKLIRKIGADPAQDKIRVWSFPADLEECMRRDEKREGWAHVGPEVIWQQYKTYKDDKEDLPDEIKVVIPGFGET